MQVACFAAESKSSGGIGGNMHNTSGLCASLAPDMMQSALPTGSLNHIGPV